MTDNIKSYQDIPGEVLVRGDLVIELSDEGEGLGGDFGDIEDDVAMLRFRVSRADASGDLDELEDSSYCTDMPADTDVSLRQAGLDLIAREVGDALEAGRSIKRTCAELSYLGALVTGTAPRV